MWLQPLFIFIIIIIKRLIKEIYRHKLHQFAMQINQSDVMILNRGVTLNIRWKSNKGSCFSHHKCLLAFMICLPAQVIIEMKKKLRFKCGDLLLQSYRRECWANPEQPDHLKPTDPENDLWPLCQYDLWPSCVVFRASSSADGWVKRSGDAASVFLVSEAEY